MVEVWLPTLGGRCLLLPPHTQPEKDMQAILDHLQVTLLPNQPPRIKAVEATLPTSPEAADPALLVVKTFSVPSLNLKGLAQGRSRYRSRTGD